MPFLMSWRVYGVKGHRQKASFGPSVRWDFSNERDGVRIFEAENSDKTGTNDYTVVHITRNTALECTKEMSGQLTDGYFENSRFGEVVEIERREI